MEAVEKALSVSKSQIKELCDKLSALYNHVHRENIEALEDEFPNWRDIVGAPDRENDGPDDSVPFRKWLAGKSSAYRHRIESTSSSELISEAIRLFRKEQGLPK